MNGFEFYQYLFNNLIPGQIISEPNQNGNTYNFIQWQNNGSLKFDMHNGNIKSIPQIIIVLAKDAFNHDPNIYINNAWLLANGYRRGGCAANVLRYLLENYPV
jgi:hypothetical protein